MNLYYDILRSISYKPGWSFRLDENEFGYTALIVDVVTDNSIGEGKVLVQHRHPVPLHFEPNYERFLRLVMIVIEGIEIHEAREFFKIHGEAPFFPHHEGQPGCDCKDCKYKRYNTYTAKGGPVPLFPNSDRIPATDGKPSKETLQGSDVEVDKQEQQTEAPVLDPETGKADGPTTLSQVQKQGVIDLDPDDPPPNQMGGKKQ